MAEAGHLLVRRGDEPWRRPEVQAYANERGLQDVLVETPDLIPGVGLAAAVDEFPVPGIGAADVVAVEPRGAVTVVECKLRTNADIRRTVVGQVLAYAAGLWHMSFDEFARRFAARTGGASLLDAVATVAGDAETTWDPEEFRSRVATALSTGTFRLCIAVDEITEELKSIIELLNLHTSAGFEVVLLELQFVSDGEFAILIPNAYGLESAKLKPKAEADRHWTVVEVFAALEELCTPAGLDATGRLFDHVLALGADIYHGRGTYPTLGVYLQFGDSRRSVFAIYADPSGPGAPRISLSFGALVKSVGPEQVKAFVQALGETPLLASVVEAAKEADAFNVYPNIPIDRVLGQPGVADAIIAAIDEHIVASVQT